MRREGVIYGRLFFKSFNLSARSISGFVIIANDGRTIDVVADDRLIQEEFFGKCLYHGVEARGYFVGKSFRVTAIKKIPGREGRSYDPCDED